MNIWHCVIDIADEDGVKYSSLSVVYRIHLGTVDTDYSNLSRIKLFYLLGVSWWHIRLSYSKYLYNLAEDSTVFIRGSIYISGNILKKYLSSIDFRLSIYNWFVLFKYPPSVHGAYLIMCTESFKYSESFCITEIIIPNRCY